MPTGDFVYRWADSASAANDQRKNAAVEGFANDGAIGTGGSAVFRQEEIPELNPKLFTIPPFE